MVTSKQLYLSKLLVSSGFALGEKILVLVIIYLGVTNIVVTQGLSGYFYG